MAADAGASLVDARLLGRPRAYSGNSQEWNAFKVVFKSYIGVVAHPILTAMDHAETLNDPITLGGLFPEVAQLSRSLSFLLAQVLSGPPLQLMMNVGDQNGLEAWRLLVRAEQSVSGANRIAAMQSILQYKFSPGIDKEEARAKERAKKSQGAKSSRGGVTTAEKWVVTKLRTVGMEKRNRCTRYKVKLARPVQAVRSLH